MVVVGLLHKLWLASVGAKRKKKKKKKETKKDKKEDSSGTREIFSHVGSRGENCSGLSAS